MCSVKTPIVTSGLQNYKGQKACDQSCVLAVCPGFIFMELKLSHVNEAVERAGRRAKKQIVLP